MQGQRSAVREGIGFVTELVKIIIIAIALIVPIRLFLVQPFYVQGASMYPNFIENDYLLVDEITYGLRSPVTHRRMVGGRDPRRGEIVVFRCQSPQCGNSRGDYLIKRVIGLPGETLILQGGKVIIKNVRYPDGVSLEESYVAPSRGYFGQDGSTYTLADDHYFLLGDNRDVSFDSEDFGPVPLTAIVGRAFVRGWPFSRAGVLSSQLYPSL